MKITNTQIEKLIPETRGNMAQIARKLGVTRTAVWLRVDKSEKLKKLVEDQRESLKDDIENVFYNKALEGSTPELIFYMKTQCRDRGYVETHRQEITGADGDAIEIKAVDITSGLTAIAPRPVQDSDAPGES